MALSPQDELQKHLPLVSSGKVREIYEIDAQHLLFVTTDRISGNVCESSLDWVATDSLQAYDVIMNNVIEGKGAILTQLSEFWFQYLQSMMPSLRTHYVSIGLPPMVEDRLPPHVATKFQLHERSMVVRRLKVFPIESIVRGYITGSAWASYQKDGTVCGIQLPAGLQESQQFQRPIWTPSTKADLGGKDENISSVEAARIVGKEYADQIETLSLQIYHLANAYAAERGIIIADTKFEFGLDESTLPPTVVLIDEAITPDSSRFWNADNYKVGQGQDSYDKQYLRDWLSRNGLKGKEGVKMPNEVASNTLSRYKEAYRSLTGRSWFPAA
ncbi:Bifunctional purine biosynthetic protein ade1 [Lecanora helva]